MQITRTQTIEIWREEVANVFLEAVKLKCSSLYEHSKMTANVMSAVATAFKFDSEEVSLLKSAALLHDAGKISVRTDILLKPGALNKSEWEQMKLHPEAGGEALGRITGLARVKDIVESHHEHDDRSGYPRGLSGEEISFESKLLRAADIYSAMLMKRSYKHALPLKSVIEEVLHRSKSLSSTEQDVLRYTLIDFYSINFHR